ncbi:hypothetical protein ACWIGI_34495 [Nocardia sp. NPDC055321]
MTTISTPRAHRRGRAAQAARVRIREFITELVAAGIRPTEHHHGASAGRRASISVVGWSVGGCRGLVRGCGPDCDLVITTNAQLVILCEQPPRARLSRTRPRYVDLGNFPDLDAVLVLARATLLPRARTA